MTSHDSGLSRRTFFGVGAGGLAAGTALSTLSLDQALAQEAVQAPPPRTLLPSSVQTPGIPTLRRIAEQYGLEIGENELAQLRKLMAGGLMPSYKRLDQYAEPALPVDYPRAPGHRPTAADNKNNAWYWRCSIKGASSGILAGKTVGIKDAVMVAGVPMMYGASMLEGYVPDQDATIVTRILDAGGEIVGKTTAEQFGFSGSSHTSDTGPVTNPFKDNYSAGGSSSGSAVAVVNGDCDMATGGDTGGSIRIPCAWSGAIGMKPTFGLVPTTGAVAMEATLDHIGPIARTTEDCALLLEAMAGPEQYGPHRIGLDGEAYSQALTGDAKGLKIGVLTEGFGFPSSEADVDQLVGEAANRLTDAGAEVAEVSVPMHRDAAHIWNGIIIEGAHSLMIQANATGTNRKGHYFTAFQDFYARSRLTRPNDYSETVKLLILIGQYMQDNYQGHYYAKAQNLARVLQAAYDQIFESVDLLVLPTTPMKATELPPVNASMFEMIAHALPMIPNTAPFNVTGNPALSIPCGASAGLPVGMMMVGRFGADATVLRAAHAFEQLG